MSKRVRAAIDAVVVTDAKGIVDKLASYEKREVIAAAFWNADISGKKEETTFLQAQGIHAVDMPKFPTGTIVGIVGKFVTACKIAGVQNSDILQALTVNLQAITNNSTLAVMPAELPAEETSNL